MEKTKRYYLIAALLGLIVLSVIGISHVNSIAKKGEIDDTAVARGEEEEGEIHYIDDSAIAMAGEAASTNTAGEAIAVLAQVNSIRANAGLSQLVWSDGLAAAAQVRAQECEHAFSHTRPNGTDWWTVNSALMYGENLAWNYFDCGSVCSAWMASPTHAANILGGFRTMGVAAYQTPSGAWYWAQEFGY